MEYKWMTLGVIICIISVFFIHNSYQPPVFFLGCIIFIIGTSIRYKEVEEKDD